MRHCVYQGWCLAWEQSSLIHLHPELPVVIQEHSLSFVSYEPLSFWGSSADFQGQRHLPQPGDNFVK